MITIPSHRFALHFFLTVLCCLPDMSFIFLSDEFSLSVFVTLRRLCFVSARIHAMQYLQIWSLSFSRVIFFPLSCFMAVHKSYMSAVSEDRCCWKGDAVFIFSLPRFESMPQILFIRFCLYAAPYPGIVGIFFPLLGLLFPRTMHTLL